MYDSVPAQLQTNTSNVDNAAFVFLGIFLVALAVPASFIVWAIASGLVAFLG